MYSGGYGGSVTPTPPGVSEIYGSDRGGGAGGSAPKGAEPGAPLGNASPPLDKFLNTPLVKEIKEIEINRVTVRVD